MDPRFHGDDNITICIALFKRTVIPASYVILAKAGILWGELQRGSRHHFGEMSEWLKEHAWKACGCRKMAREFESLSLRFTIKNCHPCVNGEPCEKNSCYLGNDRFKIMYDFEEYWQKALKGTEIIRSRVRSLSASSDTRVPYIFLAESSINEGDTIVRKGEVMVAKPSIIVPPNNPQFEGFEFEDEGAINENSLINFLLVRGITLPSMHYDNKTNSLDIREGRLSEAIKHYQKNLQQQENVNTGLIKGPEDCWQFSLLIFICTQIARNVEMDMRKLLDEYHRRDDAI